MKSRASHYPRSRVLVSVLATSLLISGLAEGASASTLTFHFDSSPSGPFNPTFTEGSLSVAFSTDASVTPTGVVQFVGGVSYAGPGSLRLSDQAVGGFDVGAFMTFSSDVYGIQLYAFQCQELFGVGPVSTPFSFAAYDSDDNLLGTFSTTQFSDCLAASYAYQLLQFTSPVGIRKVRLLGVVNVSYFDEMTIETDMSSPVRAKSWGQLKTTYR
jgi:hypothetical protein